MTLAIIVTSTSFLSEDHFEQTTPVNSPGDHSTECNSVPNPKIHVFFGKKNSGTPMLAALS